MEVNRLPLHLCDNDNCSRIAYYGLTDIRYKGFSIDFNDDGEVCCNEGTETIVVGHSCEHHIEEVKEKFTEKKND